MDKSSAIKVTGKIISHPISQIVAQAGMVLSCNPEIMKYSGVVGIVQAEFSNFLNLLIKDIQSDKGIDFEKINQRDAYYLLSKVLREVYFEDSETKKAKYRNLILSSLQSVSFDIEISKEHLTTLTQISDKEMAILKQAMISKTDKNGFNNEFDYWGVFRQFEDKRLLTKEEYLGYINHLIGLGLLNHSQMSLIGDDKSVYAITTKGISFFSYIKLGET